MPVTSTKINTYLLLYAIHLGKRHLFTFASNLNWIELLTVTVCTCILSKTTNNWQCIYMGE